jgi:hypothetical protein
VGDVIHFARLTYVTTKASTTLHSALTGAGQVYHLFFAVVLVFLQQTCVFLTHQNHEGQNLCSAPRGF